MIYYFIDGKSFFLLYITVPRLLFYLIAELFIAVIEFALQPLK